MPGEFLHLKLLSLHLGAFALLQCILLHRAMFGLFFWFMRRVGRRPGDVRDPLADRPMV